MNFYEYIYILSYMFLYIPVVNTISNHELKITETGLYKVSPCSLGLQFLVNVNNTAEFTDYDVELIPDQCCLELGSGLDCDVLEIVGSCSKTIPKGESTTLKLVAPILDPYDRHGYCIAFLDSKRSVQKRHTMRDSIKIPFDTRIKKKRHTDDMVIPSSIKTCRKIDEDPLDDCKPVDCEVFYNGHKSFYNRRLKRCVEVPPCLTAADEEMPSSTYDPINNVCLREEPVSYDDIEFVKGLSRKNGRVPKDIVIIKKFEDKPVKSDVYSFQNADDTLRHYHRLNKAKGENAVTEKPLKIVKDKLKILSDKIKLKVWWQCALDYIKKNETGLIFLGVLVFIQCILIMMMIYYLSKNCLCQKSKDVEDKYFNYRQDASVTTPLIGTTNVETETTCQFMSESSNIERRIQCYKACQKENPKFSMSDDILSKCLNRRNWDHKQVKSEAVDMSKVSFKDTNEESAKIETLYVCTKKQTEAKVNFENEREIKSRKDDRKPKVVKSIVKKVDGKRSEVKSRRKELGDSEIVPSEQEIKCYNYSDTKFKSSKPIGFDSEKEIKCHSYNYMINGSDNLSQSPSRHVQKQKNIYKDDNKESRSNLTIEKGQASAQASFSNDSIDDLLSERGVLFLTGENISDTSKFTFSNGSVGSMSSISSKTSKNNNIVKSVLSYFKKGPKAGPSSDPGGKKSKEIINLELIHMSRASMYSSSNNEECIKPIPRVKDSRTSL